MSDEETYTQRAIRELGEACEYHEDADSPVGNLIDYKNAVEDALGREGDALDRINAILSAPTWSVGMLEDICEIVRETGRPAVDSDYIHH